MIDVLRKSFCLDDELPEFDLRLPKYEHNPDFCGPEKIHLCVHLATPAHRVCTDVENFGRRFFGRGFEVSFVAICVTKQCMQNFSGNCFCPSYLQGASACDYVEWIDQEWDGRAKTVIGELAMKNMKLESAVKLCEAEIEKNQLEKRAKGRLHKERLV